MKIRNLLYGFIFIFTGFSSILQQAYSQNIFSKYNCLYLNLNFKQYDLKPLTGTTTKVVSTESAPQEFKSIKDSLLKIQLGFDKMFTVIVSKEGYVPIRISVDTHIKGKKGKIKLNFNKSEVTKLYYELNIALPLCLSSGFILADSTLNPRMKVFFRQSANSFDLDSTFFFHKANYSLTESQSLCSRLSNELKTEADSGRSAKYVDYNAKLVYGAEKTSLVDQGLHLKDSKGEVVQSARTDVYGDFTFRKLNAKDNFNIVLEKNDKLPSGETVFLADQKGSVTQELTRDKNNDFAFDLLSNELMQLTQRQEDDNADKLRKFKEGTEKELLITEHILYAPGEWTISPGNEKKLAGLIETMQQNPTFKIEIFSYTDAVGDARTNMELSNKRAKTIYDLFIGKGIKAGRMLWKGFGETKILNRCLDGVPCSEEEQQVNRRTEFRIIKDEK